MNVHNATDRILITGSNGFIGKHLTKGASREGLKIRATDISSPSDLPDDVEFVCGDITSIEFNRTITKDLVGVIHLAAVSRVSTAMSDPANCILTNVSGTAALLQALSEMRNKPWFIMISTREVEQITNPDTFPGFTNIYAISKRAAEDIAIWFCRNNNSRLYIFRLSDVYGDLESGNGTTKVLPIFLSRALQNLQIEVNHPDMPLYFSHIKDVVSALLQGVKDIRCINAGIEIRKVWPDQCTSLLDLAKLICTLTSSHSEIRVATGLKTFPDPVKSDIDGCLSEYQFKQTLLLEDGLRSLIMDMNKTGRWFDSQSNDCSGYKL